MNDVEWVERIIEREDVPEAYVERVKEQLFICLEQEGVVPNNVRDTQPVRFVALFSWWAFPQGGPFWVYLDAHNWHGGFKLIEA